MERASGEEHEEGARREPGQDDHDRAEEGASEALHPIARDDLADQP